MPVSFPAIDCGHNTLTAACQEHRDIARIDDGEGNRCPNLELRCARLNADGGAWTCGGGTARAKDGGKEARRSHPTYFSSHASTCQGDVENAPRPNGSRLSCGALKNNSFPNLRAPAASSAC
jgi:hypothetical protein